GEETEAAVLAGLRYLSSIQHANGSWGSSRLDQKYGDRRPGKTGLVLLAFLGSGYNQVDGSEFTDVVTKGIKFLLSQQDSDVGHFGNCSAYGHGISTYALAEAFAMTKDALLRAPIMRGVRRIVRAQFDSRRPELDGGWGYYYRDTERRYDNWPRMSVTVWQIMALKSAKIGGLSVPSRVLDRAKSFVLASRDSRLKALRYNQDPDWLASGFPTLPGSSAAGLFAMQLFDVSESNPSYRTALNYVVQRPPRFRWRRASSSAFVNRGEGNLYFHYYAALALHRNGGAVWDGWNSQLKPILLDNQEGNGSWRPISQYNKFANETSRDRSYTTAISVLMLEVYYRYFTPLTEDHQKGRNNAALETMPQTGVEISSVRSNSSADDLGLEVGDRIISVRSQPVVNTSDLRRHLKSWPRNDAGTVEVVRGQRKVVLTGNRRPGGFQALSD
ncbi:MAG: molybdopterin-binding protein, partial [Planctomycetota bacterium]